MEGAVEALAASLANQQKYDEASRMSATARRRSSPLRAAAAPRMASRCASLSGQRAGGACSSRSPRQNARIRASVRASTASPPSLGSGSARASRHRAALRALIALLRHACGASLRSTWDLSSGSISLQYRACASECPFALAPLAPSSVSAIALPSRRRARDCAPWCSR